MINRAPFMLSLLDKTEAIPRVHIIELWWTMVHKG